MTIRVVCHIQYVLPPEPCTSTGPKEQYLLLVLLSTSTARGGAPQLLVISDFPFRCLQKIVQVRAEPWIERLPREHDPSESPPPKKIVLYDRERMIGLSELALL